MAWSEPATDKQIRLLGDYYISIVLTASDEAKEIGSRVKGELIEEMLDEGVVRNTIRKHTRKQASEAIEEFPLHGSMPNNEIWKEIENIFAGRDIDISCFYEHYLEKGN